MNDTQKNIDSWLNGSFDDQTLAEVKDLLKTPEKAADAFYSKLKFGTGGMRGLMGVGTNRINTYTIRGATQGLANYLKKQPFANAQISVLISYDSRINSKEFALEAARVLAKNEIKTYLVKNLRPVPLVSFGTRLKNCQAGIMITASHNPKEYNGYKVYWSDGAQVLPPHDTGIIEEVNKIDALDKIEVSAKDSPLIQYIEEELDEAYLTTIEKLQKCIQDNQTKGDRLNIIYTSLHGAGITMVPAALGMWGFINTHIVEAQSTPDGTFPTVPAPNPEIPEALKIGIEKLTHESADILLATDPDTDRVGCAVNHLGDVTILNGNEIAVLCLHHLLTSSKLPSNAATVKTIVTTELFKAISESYGATCFDVLTGFKYIGQLITSWEKDPNGYTYIFGGEESYGYLLSDYARDKDAVISCCVLAEAALQAKLKEKTLVDKLHEIYAKYGVYRTRLLSVNFPESQEGRESMKQAMIILREKAPQALLGTKVTKVEDFLKHPTLPKSNVLIYHLADGTKICVRPSGTEPKVKLYCEVSCQKPTTIAQGIEQCDVLTRDYLSTLKSLISNT